MPRIVRTAAALALLAGNTDLAATQGGSADLRLATLEELMSIEVGALGNPEFSNEHLVNTEAGYRFNPGSVWSLDVVGFSGRYDDLQTYEPLAPAVETDAGVPQIKMLTRYENLMRADTRGAEVASRVQLRDGWQVDGAFSAFHLTSHANGCQDPLFSRGLADVHLFRTGPIPQLGVEPHTRLDTRAEWWLTGQLSAVVSGQSLLSGTHSEFRAHETNMQATLVPRSGGLRLLWRS